MIQDAFERLELFSCDIDMKDKSEQSQFLGLISNY